MIDVPYLKKKGLMVMPSAMGISKKKGFVSDGTRVVYLICNGKIPSLLRNFANKFLPFSYFVTIPKPSKKTSAEAFGLNGMSMFVCPLSELENFY